MSANGVSYQSTGHNEWLVLLDDEPMGFIQRGRRINDRQHLWYAFDLSLESLGVEHLYRRDATAQILSHYPTQPERQQA